MHMPIGSPLQGFNHNLRHNGRQFHVQTEDSGSKNPHVFTHLYHGGVVIATMKFEYMSLLESGKTPDNPTPETDYRKALRKMMQDQHKAIMKTLRAGEFDDKIAQIFGDIRTDMAGAMAEEAAAEEQLTIDEVISRPQPLSAAPVSADASSSSDILYDDSQAEEGSDTVSPGAAEAAKTLIVLKDKATKESSSPWRYVAPRAKHRPARRVTYGIKPISGGFIANTPVSNPPPNRHIDAAQKNPALGNQSGDFTSPRLSIPPSDDSRSLDQVILDYLAEDE